MNASSSSGVLSRRGFARVLVAGPLAVGFDPLARAWVTPAQAAAPGIERLPPLDGAIHLDDATRDSYADDFGHIVHERPLAVLTPGSVEDIARLVGFARRHRLRVAARGRGHTTFGQAQVAAGVVVDLSPLRAIHAIGDDRATVDAGIRWRDLLAATLARGLTPPVLPDYIGQSVGGTLAVGGIGAMSYRHGAQVDHVLALEVVTGAGELIACSADRHPDLFAALLAGQGQCGFVVRATLRLVPAPARARVFNAVYPDYPTLSRDLRRLADDGRFDHLQGWLFRASDGSWTPLLEAAVLFTPPDRPDDAALLADLGHLPGAVETVEQSFWERAAERVASEFPREAHPWLDLFVPGPAADGFAASVMAEVTPLAPEDRLAILLNPTRRAPLTRPLFRVPDAAYSLAFGFLRFMPLQPDLVERALAVNRQLFDRNAGWGGTHYPIDALRLSRLDWRRHYGPEWGRLAAARRRYDPDNILASGPDIFGPAGGDGDQE